LARPGTSDKNDQKSFDLTSRGILKPDAVCQRERPQIKTGPGKLAVAMGSAVQPNRRNYLRPRSVGVDAMSLSRKVKTSLDENRLLLLGAQVLFGFQFQAIFQESFGELAPSARNSNSLALVLMATTIGLLIAPSMLHRITERGADTIRVHRAAGIFAGLALLPFGMSLGLDIFVVFGHVLGTDVAVVAGVLFCGVAALLWLIFGLILRIRLVGVPAMTEKEAPTSLSTRIEQMLTEARVILPGAQALFGFQLAVPFTHAFMELDAPLKLIHIAALSSVALSVLLLMTPAALHRIAFRGQDVEEFLALGSGFVSTAPIAIAFGLATDMLVAIAKATGAIDLAIAIAVTSLAALTGLWYGLPLLLRTHRLRQSRK
jgi:hypothetical protein